MLLWREKQKHSRGDSSAGRLLRLPPKQGDDEDGGRSPPVSVR